MSDPSRLQTTDKSTAGGERKVKKVLMSSFKCKDRLEDIWKYTQQVFTFQKVCMCTCICVVGKCSGFFFSFCVVVTTGQSLARCQQGPASNLEVEHNR